MIIVVVDTPSSVEINAGGSHWRPIQDGGLADMLAPIGSVSLRGVYVYYVYGVTDPDSSSELCDWLFVSEMHPGSCS